MYSARNEFSMMYSVWEGLLCFELNLGTSFLLCVLSGSKCSIMYSDWVFCQYSVLQRLFCYELNMWHNLLLRILSGNQFSVMRSVWNLSFSYVFSLGNKVPVMYCIWEPCIQSVTQLILRYSVCDPDVIDVFSLWTHFYWCIQSLTQLLLKYSVSDPIVIDVFNLWSNFLLFIQSVM